MGADLAQHQLFSDASLVSYLEYLLYWKQPAYACFLAYPSCLAMLELLQEPDFRASLASPEAAEFVWRTHFHQWQCRGASTLAGAQAASWSGLRS